MSDLSAINRDYAAWAASQGGNVDVNSQGFKGFENRLINQIGQIMDPAVLQQQLQQQMGRVDDPTYGASARNIVGALQNQLATATAGQGPPTGLIGYEQALQGGANAAMGALSQGYGQAQGALTPVGPGDMSRVNAALQPFQQTGGKAFDLQGALSGALGPEAQKQAYANYQGSPGQQFLRDRAEQALLRNSAALGGLGGGRVRQELQRQAIGEAEQSFGNDFARLGHVAGVGANAAGQVGTIAGSLEGQRMGLNSAQQQLLAQIASNTGTNAANIASTTGQQLARGRFDTGINLANAAQSTISALSDLANQQGQDISSTIGQGSGDLSNILAAAGQGDAQALQNLATIIANINAGQGSNVGSLPGIPGVQDLEGILGKLGEAMEGGAKLAAVSDIRLKENIQQVGTAKNGIPLYVWDWNDDGQRVTGETSGFGVIAQEVRETHPNAVIEDEDGWLRVKYGVLFNV
jgi:hypothetical protein